MNGMAYNRTQYGRWHYLLVVFTAATLLAVWLTRRTFDAWLWPRELVMLDVVLVIAAIFALCGLLFGSLTIRDEGQWLALRFGPLPLIHKRICYAEITDVEAGRSRILDGWGIHYFPGRGWTYNIWGFGCVKLTLGRKIIRIGSDDAENLAKFLREKLQASGLPIRP